jgi:hypothetical protein
MCSEYVKTQNLDMYGYIVSIHGLALIVTFSLHLGLALA